jgi:hypothetical protein
LAALGSIFLRNTIMKSFVFWLATAGAIGALAGSTLHAGLPEIVIVWGVVIGLHYGWRSLATKHRSALPREATSPHASADLPPRTVKQSVASVVFKGAALAGSLGGALGTVTACVAFWLSREDGTSSIFPVVPIAVFWAAIAGSLGAVFGAMGFGVIARGRLVAGRSANKARPQGEVTA